MNRAMNWITCLLSRPQTFCRSVTIALRIVHGTRSSAPTPWIGERMRARIDQSLYKIDHWKNFKMRHYPNSWRCKAIGPKCFLDMLGVFAEFETNLRSIGRASVYRVLDAVPTRTAKRRQPCNE